MIAAAEIRRIFVASLMESTFSRSRSKWIRTGRDVQWTIQLDASSWGNQVDVVVGLDLQSERELARADDSGIVLYLGSSSGLSRMLAAVGLETSDVYMAGTVQSPLTVAERAGVINMAVSALDEYTAQHLDLERVRAAFAAEDFRGGAIKKDARDLLIGR